MGSDVWCTPRWVDLDPGRSTYGKCYVPRVVAFPIQIHSRSAWPMHACMCVRPSVVAGPAGARYGVLRPVRSGKPLPSPEAPTICISSTCVNRLIWLDQSLRSAS